jgi:lauroyl/myristoyl acyltransferase
MDASARILYAILSALARVLPPAVSYLLGETLAALCFLLCATRRRNSAANLRVVLGAARTANINRLVLRTMINFGRTIVETFMIPHISAGRIPFQADIIGRDRLESIAAGGRGIVLVTAHLGSWEIGGLFLARLGYKITTVAGVQLTRGLSPFIKSMKEECGLSVVAAEGGTLRLFRALKRGQVVALHIDGDQYLGGVETEFFGSRTVLPRGPAALALRTRAAVVPAFAIRIARGKIKVLIGDEIETGGHDESSLTRKIALAVEAYIRRKPDQWCMFRRIWEA